MSRLRWLPALWAVLLAVLMLWPVLGTGYVLSYDMVWVPDLALRGDFLGLGSGLPRAVPSDAVVAVLDEVVPGMVLQKLVLLGALVAGGVGAARLAPSASLVGQLVAVSFYEWSPFVAERLLIGHWPVLLCYGALPWIIVAARRMREQDRVPVSLFWLLPVASLSASAGLIAAVTLLAFALGRRVTRAGVAAVALVAMANAPWVVSGLLHAGVATTDGAGARDFALSGEGRLPGPVAALGLGGIWNAEVVPGAREGLLAWVSLAVVAGLAALGARAWFRATGRRDVLAFVGCWCVGWGLAVLTWAAPDQFSWLVAEVPGVGLVRDGARMLALCAPLLCALVAYGSAELSRLLPRTVPRVPIGLALVLVPVAVLPDAALGLAGKIRVAEYPTSYAAAREAVQALDDQGEAHDVLVLPFTSYRAPAWNHGHKVLDPVGRYLTPDYVASDELSVDGHTIAGEDPRGAAVRVALAAADAEQRARKLAALGIGTVVTERGAGATPRVAGRTVLVTGELSVVGLGVPVRDSVPPRGWVVLMALAWLGFLGMLLAGVVTAGRGVVHRAVKSPVAR